jgi:putative tryptophan/tyrosine transport system substrate-binding protein
MRRRDFMAVTAGAALFAAPRAVLPQTSERVKRMGVLVEYAEGDAEAGARLAALGAGLRSLGWIEGRNLRVDYRFGGGDHDRIRAFAAEFASLAPDVLLGSGAPVTAALQQATRTIPIVFVQISDPVGAGLVSSLGRPGGNVTGFTNFEYAIVGKWLETLREIAPRLARVLLLQNPGNFGWPGYLRAMETAAPAFSLPFTPAPVRDAGEIERAVAAFAQHPDGGMIVLPDTTTSVHRKLIVGLAERHRLPAVYPFRFFVTEGGLICYGIDVLDVFRQASSYVDRILRGEEAGTLPIQAASKFELVVNRATANALGLTLQPSLLARADEVVG